MPSFPPPSYCPYLCPVVLFAAHACSSSTLTFALEQTVRRPLNTIIHPLKASGKEEERLFVLGVALLLRGSAPTCLRTTPAAVKSRACILAETVPPVSAYVGHVRVEVGRVRLLPLWNRVGL